MTEREIQRAIVAHLRAVGWQVLVLSQHRRGPQQHRNAPDLVAIRADCCLLIECKAPGQHLRPGQTEFYAALQPHLGAHVRYIVLDTADARVLDTVCEEE